MTKEKSQSDLQKAANKFYNKRLHARIEFFTDSTKSFDNIALRISDFEQNFSVIRTGFSSFVQIARYLEKLDDQFRALRK